MKGSHFWCCTSVTRRRFLAIAGLGGFAGCAASGPIPSATDPVRVIARPGQPIASVIPGEHRLDLDNGRDGLLYVPRNLPTNGPVPIVVMLHGAGGTAGAMRFTFPLAEEFGVPVLAPDSRGRTWDVILGGFGPDVAFINSALEYAFDRMVVDRARIGIGGFSDGASYALSLGVANGDLFTHLLAFSPGFIAPAGRRGKPQIFISHGTMDEVLPIDRTSRTIVPDLERRGYDVRYREFKGPHSVPPDLAREAFAWVKG
jgi:phospholipase/carboxylesterase